MVLLPKLASEYIVKHAKHLKINENGVEKIVNEVLKSILNKQLTIDRFTQNGFHPDAKKPDFAIDWIFVCDTLNFCFWTPDTESKWEVNKETGYFALCAALNRAIQEGIDITNPKYYAEITEEQVRKIFRADDDNTEVPMLEQRVKCLREVGKILLNKYDGSFVNCVKKSNKSAKKLLELIIEEFPCFRDEAVYYGMKVGLYKRAQILIGDIWACFRGEGLGEFTDINESITMFADYRIPQVMIHFGALEYTPELQGVLNSNICIGNGSEMEVEIRGASIYIVEQVKKRLLAKMTDEHPELPTKFVNSILLDHFLWDYRREHAKDLQHIPFHKTRSIYY